MMFNAFLFFLIYTGVISLISMIVTVSDKAKSRKGQWRVPEKTLLIFSALGGSLAMYITMQIIRHKTRHIKFMLGIPIIMFFQAIVIWYLFNRGVFALPF
jgi:uncharacterized membrane protein YsdA (DUF1294 family)